MVMKNLGEILKQNGGAATSPTNLPMSSSAKRLAPGALRAQQTQATRAAEICPLCGGVGFLMPDLPLGHADFGKAVPCRCREQERLERRVRNLQRLGSLETLQRLTFESFIAKPSHLSPEQAHNLQRAYDTSIHYAQEPEGWLLLTGTYGCGKTHLAAAIANARLDIGQPVLFMLVPDLMDHLRTAFRPDSEESYDNLFEQVRNTPLLILDDLGTQSSTPWAQEKLFQLLNHRYNVQLPTVITTNQRLEDLEPRLRSRLLDASLVNYFTIIAPDFRQGNNPLQSDLSMLGLHQQQTFQTFQLDREDVDGDKQLKLKEVYAICQAYAQNPQGWLILMGGNGSGKTHLAAAIANSQIENGQRDTMFVSVPNLLDHLRATFSPQAATSYDRRFDEIKNIPLLILDDMGTESATPWAREKLFQLLNYRYDAALPTVITTFGVVEVVDVEDKVKHTKIKKERILTDNIEPWLVSRMQNATRCKVCVIRAAGYRVLPDQPQIGKSPTTRRTR
jgi:DNA replication protein DnaC